MLLVIISLAMATVLTVAYLASRDNSAAIGDNVIDASKARWASESGLELGIAILQTESNWRTEHVNGRLIDGMVFDDVVIDLDVLDLATDAPPTSETNHVMLISTASTGGVEQVSTVLASVEPSDDSVEVDLDEFAVFAIDRITLEDSATISTWPVAPLADSGGRNNLGTRANGLGDVTISDDAAAIDSTVWYGSDASDSLVVESVALLEQMELVDDVPVPAPPPPGVDTPEDDPTNPGPLSVAGTLEIDESSRYGSITLGSGATLTVTGDSTLVTDGVLQLGSGSSLLVTDDATLVVWGDLVITGGSIQLDGDATLTIHVAGAVTITGGYVGESVSADSFDASGLSPYFEPDRLTMVDIPNYVAGTTSWLVSGASVVKGKVYTKEASLTLEDTAALYGRSTSLTLTMREDSSIFYDPALLDGQGYTDDTSPIFEIDGTIKSAYKNLTDLSDTQLDLLATTEQVLASGLGLLFDRRAAEADDPVGPLEPTPRTVEVELTMQSIGTSIETWEATQSTPSAAMLATSTRDLASTIGAQSLSSFTGGTAMIRTSNRTALVTLANSAATKIDAADYVGAKADLNTIIQRTDGGPAVADTMAPGTPRDRVNALATSMVNGLGRIE
jgi:hypothetical protein